MAITIHPAPRAYVLDEEHMPKKSVSTGPIFHSWLRGKDTGIIGLRFSSWMIRQGNLSRVEKTTVSEWNKSEGDFEVFFGKERDFDPGANPDDEYGTSYMLRVDPATQAICFPLHGSKLAKKDLEVVVNSLERLGGAATAVADEDGPL